MCKTNVEIKDSCEVNQSQNAERKIWDVPFKKIKWFLNQLMDVWHSSRLIPEFSEAY